MQSLPEPVVEPSPNFGTEAGRDRTIGDYPPEQSLPGYRTTADKLRSVGNQAGTVRPLSWWAIRS